MRSVNWYTKRFIVNVAIQTKQQHQRNHSTPVAIWRRKIVILKIVKDPYTKCNFVVFYCELRFLIKIKYSKHEKKRENRCQRRMEGRRKQKKFLSSEWFFTIKICVWVRSGLWPKARDNFNNFQVSQMGMWCTVIMCLTRFLMCLLSGSYIFRCSKYAEGFLDFIFVIRLNIDPLGVC